MTNSLTDTKNSGKYCRILLFSSCKDNLADYANTLHSFGVNCCLVHKMKEAKDLLQSHEYNMLIADITDYDAEGRALITWAHNHITPVMPGFKTHGYTCTDLPSVMKKIYGRGSDQHFYWSTSEMDKLTEVIFALIAEHTNLRWVQNAKAELRKVRANINEDNPLSTPVLMIGSETVGMESLVQILHGINRREKDFIVLDCHATQRFDYLYDENRDTASNRRKLRKNIEDILGLACGGTLFLRAFDELSIMAQQVILEVMEAGQCRCAITGNLHPFSGRIIFSTNKELADRVALKEVDERLYKRLSQNAIRIPSLAFFKEDLVPMFEAIMVHRCLKMRGKPMKIHAKAQTLIRHHAWVNNFIEMLQVVEVALNTARNLEIRDKDLPMYTKPKRDHVVCNHRPKPEFASDEDEKAAIINALRKHRGNKSKAAEELSLWRSDLYDRMATHGIPKKFKG